MYFEIVGNPKGKQRPRHNKYTVYTPGESKDYEKLVATLYKLNRGEMLEGNLKLVIEAYYKIPKSSSKKDKLMMEQQIKRPALKPDIDNVVKIIMDGLNGVAYKDDCQVVCVVANKYYSHEPKVAVSIYNI